jgi:hypothetical protein
MITFSTQEQEVFLGDETKEDKIYITTVLCDTEKEVKRVQKAIQMLGVGGDL